jgi:methylenetetrahydrofolate dehydrogenase (NADP+)/methenyltetrahydrofolate cyclohydrolase
MPVQEAQLLEGKVLAAKIQSEISQEIAQFAGKKWERPKLYAIQVGENPASAWYVGQQEKLSAKLGIEFEKTAPKQIPDQISLLAKIHELNQSKTHGIFLALPLPSGFDVDEALLALDLHKDVEGIHPASLGLLVLRRAKLIPPTAYACLQLIESTGISLRGKKAAIVGQSAVVGRPLQLLLGERRVTTLVCNTGTSADDLQKFVSESDIVVACAGQPGLVKGNWIKPGTVVIDVGTTEVGGKLVGDIEFEEAKKRAAFITPVPGGVGPLTVTMLMLNLIHAYKWQKGIKN